MNRPGNSTPAANPSAASAASSAQLTITGHHGGPPQVAWVAVTPYSTATPARKPAIAQMVVAAQVASWGTQRGRGVISTSSRVRRRPSRDPTQAAMPTTKTTKSGSSLFGSTEARTVHTAG